MFQISPLDVVGEEVSGQKGGGYLLGQAYGSVQRRDVGGLDGAGSTFEMEGSIWEVWGRGWSFGVDAIGLGGDWLVREVTRVALAVWFPNCVDGGGFH